MPSVQGLETSKWLEVQGRQKSLTGWYTETPGTPQKKEAYGAPEAFHPSIVSRYIETELLFLLVDC
jgi:hypothetical protein